MHFLIIFFNDELVLHIFLTQSSEDQVKLLLFGESDSVEITDFNGVQDAQCLLHSKEEY